MLGFPGLWNRDWGLLYSGHLKHVWDVPWLGLCDGIDSGIGALHNSGALGDIFGMSRFPGTQGRDGEWD